jgi:hypothetical protein
MRLSTGMPKLEQYPCALRLARAPRP